MKLPRLLLLPCALSISLCAAQPLLHAQGKPDPSAAFYNVGTIPTPPGVNSQVGGLAVIDPEHFACAFHHGEIGIYHSKQQTWKIFAEGLHEPLGILPQKDGSLLVMQRAELTRLVDTDSDGVADQYQSFWSQFGISGNYHEFAFGPVQAPNGKLYVSLNLASNGDTVFREVRGDWSPIGLPREKFHSGEWKKVNTEAGRMYSRVPWRGWVIEIDPQTGSATPFASGFRSPDGIGFTPDGQLLVSDNQGDWRGTSELHVAQRNGFYGHPASLVWRNDWDGSNPIKLSIEKLNALRTPAAIWFPHGIYANSPTQMIPIPKSPAWGPFGGQMLIGEMNSPKLIRLLLEKVDGVWQGACINLAEIPALKLGLHRLAFQGDTLLIGRTHLSWAGSEGIATVTPTGSTPFDPLQIHATPDGFRLEFTEPLADSASDPALWNIDSYSYSYHAAYGSPQIGKAQAQVSNVTLSNDRRTATLQISPLRRDFIYDFKLQSIRSASGQSPLNPRLAYTLRRIPSSTH